MLNEEQSTESHWSVSVPDASQGSSFTVISATYFLVSVSCSPLFVIACGSYAWSATPIREKTGVCEIDPGNVQRGA